MANSLYQMVENHLGLRPDKKKAQTRMVETIRGMIKGAMIVAQYQDDDWSVVEPAPTLSPLKRQAEESDTETGMSTDEFANPKVLLCYCYREAILLRTKKRGSTDCSGGAPIRRCGEPEGRASTTDPTELPGTDPPLTDLPSPRSMPMMPNDAGGSLLVDPCDCKNPRLVGSGSNAWVTQIRRTQCGKMVARKSTAKAKEYYAKRNTVLPTPKELPPTLPTSSASTPKPSVMPGTPLSNGQVQEIQQRWEDTIPVLDEAYAEYQFKRFMEAKSKTKVPEPPEVRLSVSGRDI